MQCLLAQRRERRVANPEAIGSIPIGAIRRVDPWTLLALEVRRIPPLYLEWKICAAEFDNRRGKSGHLNALAKKAQETGRKSGSGQAKG